MPDSSTPSIDLAAEIARILVLVHDLRSAARKSGDIERLDRAIAAMEDALAAAPATSAAGAMGQIMLARADADTIAGMGAGAGCPYFERIDRCLQSALTVLSRHSATDPMSVGGGVYLPGT